jgi:hypothetical protein
MWYPAIVVVNFRRDMQLEQSCYWEVTQHYFYRTIWQQNNVALQSQHLNIKNKYFVDQTVTWKLIHNKEMLYLGISSRPLIVAVGRKCVSVEVRPLTWLWPSSRWYMSSTELQWNNTDRKKPKDSEKSLSHCHFLQHKSHINFTGREFGPPQWEAGY